MDINNVLAVTMVSMAAVAFAVVRLGESYFNAVSRNPVINNEIKTMLLVIASMAELLGLVMMTISLYIVFVKF